MPTSETIDNGRSLDWGRTSRDYAAFRPGPPPSFYEMLAQLGVGLPGQQVLDLGTGTGVLAREMARRGTLSQGIDISPQQIEADVRAFDADLEAMLAESAGENFTVLHRIDAHVFQFHAGS